MAEFKKIAEVDVINELTENDKVLIVDADGALKQTPSSNIKGGRGILFRSENFYNEELVLDDGYVNTILFCGDNYDELYDVLMSGTPVSISDTEAFAAMGWDNYSTDTQATNVGQGASMICSWHITDKGLYVETWNYNVNFPNGSHNLEPNETPES